MKSSLKIAIDGRNLSSNINGIGRYISETVHALSYQNIQIEILHHKPVNPNYLSYLNASNIRFRQTSNQFGLPRYMPTQETVFWGPAHRFPIHFPKSLPAVLTVHDLVWKKFPNTMNKRTFLGERLFFKHAINRANKIVCVSQSTADDLHHFFPTCSKKIKVIHLGANEPSCMTRHRGKPFALFVGTMEPRKNLYRLIEAYTSMSLKDKIDLVLVGGKGWGGMDVEKKLAHRNRNSNIRIITQASDTTINQLYADCHFLVMPSLYEGFGLPLVEAMKYGKPVLTSNVASMPEVAGNAGLLIDPTDTVQIASAITRLVMDEKLYLNLSLAAKKQAALFSWDKSASSLLLEFQTL